MQAPADTTSCPKGNCASQADPLLSNPIKGTLVIARNGDRFEMFQDPNNYASSLTQTTPLGEAQSHQLGGLLRSIYLSPSSSSYIKGMQSDVVKNEQIHVRVKAGGEGSVIFDSAIALLQGLFPPSPNNKILLANETTIVAPLGGYQYVPVETVEPGNDRSLEPWTSCPAFEKHVSKFYTSDSFKAMAKEAEPFFKEANDFVFGRPLKLENSWNLYDYISSELTHNKTYAYRLPPRLAEKARTFADFHEDGIFSDDDPSGVGNIAGRTLLHTIISSLERFSAPSDPLQFVVVETSYHPFISLFHQTEITQAHPELKGIPDYASALAIELRSGPPPDARDFVRFKFKNGTSDFQTIHVFNHKDDIPLTEFIYRIENSAVTSNKQWAQICNAKSISAFGFDIPTPSAETHNLLFGVFVLLAFAMLATFGFVRRARARAHQRQVKLQGDDVIPVVYRDSHAEKVRFI